MPRNDESRLKVQDKGGNPPPSDKNSLLNFVIPTEFVELPTAGKFYPPEHPLHQVETVEMRYMTAKETDILTSKSLLKKGIAVDRMLENLFVDKEIKARELFIGDKNALILAARVNGFGSDYEAQITCMNCGTTANHEFELSEVVARKASEDIKFSNNGTFFIKLPQTAIEAECRLLTGEDEKQLVAKADKKKKLKLPDTSLTDQYKKIIVSLNEVSDRGQVEEFVDLMPAKDAMHLRKEYESARPDMDMSYSYECETCEAENKVDIPFSANFFWPD
jgi:hypothetical protein